MELVSRTNVGPCSILMKALAALLGKTRNHGTEIKKRKSNTTIQEPLYINYFLTADIYMFLSQYSFLQTVA